MAEYWQVIEFWGEVGQLDFDYAELMDYKSGFRKAKSKSYKFIGCFPRDFFRKLTGYNIEEEDRFDLLDMLIKFFNKEGYEKYDAYNVSLNVIYSLYRCWEEDRLSFPDMLYKYKRQIENYR